MSDWFFATHRGLDTVCVLLYDRESCPCLSPRRSRDPLERLGPGGVVLRGPDRSWGAPDVQERH